MLLRNENPRKTTVERLKVIVKVLTLTTLIISTHAAATNRANNECPKTCHTEVCGDEAIQLIKLMDDQVDPCENFYDFVCGSYTKNVPIEEYSNAASIIVDHQTAITARVYADVSEKIKEDDLDTVKKMKTYYQNCVDERTINQIGTRPLLKILNAIGGWPVVLGDRWDERRYDFMQAVFEIKRQRGPLFFPVLFTIDIDNVDSAKYAINLDNANLNVDASWFADSNDRDKISRIFLDMLMKVAVKFGARNDSTTLREMQQVKDFEIDLYHLATPPEQLVNLPLERSRLNLRDLSHKHPSIPWIELINNVLRPTGISVNENEYVYVLDPDFVSKLTKLLERTPKRVLGNYIAWRLIQLNLSYMPNDLSSIATDYNNARVGTSGEDFRMAVCQNQVQEIFPLGVSALYIRKHFREPVQRPVTEMFELIKSQARKNLQENKWMDEATKRIAMEKIDAMGAMVAYNDELMDDRKVDEYYRELHINPGSHMESAFNVSYFTEQKTNGRLRKPTMEDQWTTKQSAVELNAYMMFQENSIELPAGFLKSFYGLNKPQYMNYGIAGAFIGHEVFHGFDNQGKQFDKRGNQVNWWQPETEEKYNQKSQCFIEQYGNFTDPIANMKINGELTLGENIADNGGFKVAYYAYNEWLKRHNITEGCLPSLNYTPQQMYWISSASIWCANERPEYVRSTLTTDNHSSNMGRVLLTFSNMKEFSDDFKCRPGSRMNPHKKCQIW